MAQIIIQFRPELDVTFRNGVFISPTKEAAEPLNSLLRRFPSAQVEPVFGENAGTVPDQMRRYYAINLTDADRAQALQRELQQLTSLEAAYIKPSAELP